MDRAELAAMSRSRSRSLDPTRVVGRLNIEWEHLAERPIPVELGPLLPGARTLGDLDQRLPRLPESTRDAVLLALLSCPADRPCARRLAERAVLQMLLGTALSSLRAGDRVDLGRAGAEQLAVTCLVEVIATYGVNRTAVWVNLVCDTRRLIGVRRAHERHVAEREIPMARIDGQASAECHPSEEMLRLLTWAVRTRALDRETAALLARRYRRPDAVVGERPDGGGFLDDPAALAAKLDLERATVRKRCSRAVDKLRAAVGDCSLDEIAA